MEKKYIVTIDGPAGAGKSTSAAKLAARLGWIYLNSGFLYRAITLLGIRAKLFEQHEVGSEELEEKLVAVTHASSFSFEHNGDGTSHLIVNGTDTTPFLKIPDVETRVSPVAQYMKIRALVGDIQHRVAAESSLIAEGRDIGSAVFPEADVKFYLTVSLDTQAERLMKDRMRRGDPEMSLEALKSQIAARDANDLKKHLRKPPDAIEINTDVLDPHAQIDLLERHVRERLGL